MQLRVLVFLSILPAANLLPGTNAQAQQPFTLQQALSAPYANQLTAASVGNLFAWVEDAEGRHNLYIGGPSTPARALTHNSEDDGQDITQLAWSPDASAIAYTCGAPTGADGKPANPAHLQRATPVQVIVQSLTPDAQPAIIGEGRAPLFTHDGRNLLFTRDGQIWIAASTLPAATPPCPAGATICDLPVNDRRFQGPRQLVYDRGTATSLTLSPDGTLLAFISRRREANEPAHTFLALFNLTTHTLTFPAPTTSNDSAPAFSPDGKQLAWLRSPFTDTPEFANPRTSPIPWSIQLLDLTPTDLSSRPQRSEVERPASGTATEPPTLDSPTATPTDLSSRPKRSEAERPASGTATEPRTLDSPTATPTDLSSRPKRSEAERPASGTATEPRTLYSPNPNQPGSVLPDLSTGAPYLLWTADKRIIFYSEADGWLHLYSITLDPTSRTPALLTPGDYEVEDAVTSGDKKSVVYSSNKVLTDALDRDRRHIWYLDVSKSAPSPLPAFLSVSIETSPKSSTGEAIATLASTWDKPSFVTFIVPTASLTERKGLLPPTYPATAFVTPTQVLFPSSDGLQLHSQLFLPTQTADASATLRNDNAARDSKTPTATRHPAILFLHGGPRRQMLLGYPEMEYYSNAYAMNQYLTSRGFIVLSLNYRCGIGYGLDFRTCQHAGATGATEYNDVLAAQRYLASRPDVDPKRIGIWGGSYGGYLTALALSRNSDLFAAGVDFHGVHDWNLEDNASDWKRGSFAEQDAIAATALASSPLADISHWHSPILLIHGDNDPNVAYAQTPLLAEALRARNAALPNAQQVDVEELIFPDELHEFLLHKDWLAAYTAAAAFFERTLKP